MLLSELGTRICILGPSNSGKSSLADAIARKLALNAVHLDRFYHLPHTDWEPRPIDEFIALHDEAIASDAWVMDGNYTNCLPQRLRRATGIIVLDVSTLTSLLRYARRTIFERHRAGALEGDHDSIKWSMIRHIVLVTPHNRRRYAKVYRELELSKVFLPSVRAIEGCYSLWDLERRASEC